MGHVDVNAITVVLPDGRPLLDEVTFRVGEGAKVALVGPNGTGKTTLLRVVAGDQAPDGGAITRTGGLGVMRQFVGRRDHALPTAGGGAPTVRDLLASVAPSPLRDAVHGLDASELEMMEVDDTAAQMRYAQALADYADAGGYDAETLWDVVTTAAMGVPYDRARWRELTTLSGGEQKRLVLEALLRGPDEVLLLDEPDNYLDVPAKRWLEDQLLASGKTVLFVSHDRELLSRVATRVVTLEPGAAGSSAWVHGGSFATWRQARADRMDRLDELRRRWDEEHAKLRAQMLMYKQKAAYNSDMASRYASAQTRLRRFEDAGPPQERPRERSLSVRLRGGRTGKRAVVCEQLGLSGLMQPFDTELWFGDRVAVLGSNGSGKSHFLRLLAGGGTDPDAEHRPVGDLVVDPVAHTGVARLGARVRPGWFAQTHARPDLTGAREGANGSRGGTPTLLEILHRGDEHRAGMPREEASRALDRYELAGAAERGFDTLSGGQQARFQILLLELSGATLLLLDEPTDNLDLESAEALEAGLAAFEGTVVAVTHDRWFARGFDRFLVFRADGTVVEADEPVWHEGRVARAR